MDYTFYYRDDSSLERKDYSFTARNLEQALGVFGSYISDKTIIEVCPFYDIVGKTGKKQRRWTDTLMFLGRCFKGLDI